MTSHFKHIATIIKGIKFKETIIIQVYLTVPVASYNTQPRMKETNPPKDQLIIGAVPKYGATFFDVIYLIKEGIMATKVPTVHPMPKRNIISTMISVQKVVIVKMSAHILAVNNIDLCLKKYLLRTVILNQKTASNSSTKRPHRCHNRKEPFRRNNIACKIEQSLEFFCSL